MIEVFWHDDGRGWAWKLICAVGRVLVYTDDRFPTILDAAEAAKAYRTAFWAVADLVDHRQARAI